MLPRELRALQCSGHPTLPVRDVCVKPHISARPATGQAGPDTRDDDCMPSARVFAGGWFHGILVGPRFLPTSGERERTAMVFLSAGPRAIRTASLSCRSSGCAAARDRLEVPLGRTRAPATPPARVADIGRWNLYPPTGTLLPYPLVRFVLWAIDIERRSRAFFFWFGLALSLLFLSREARENKRDVPYAARVFSRCLFVQVCVPHRRPPPSSFAVAYARRKSLLGTGRWQMARCAPSSRHK